MVDRRVISVPPPTFVGVTASGETVEYPAPLSSPNGGVSTSRVRREIRKNATTQAVPRLIYPSYDVTLSAGFPYLVYQIGTGATETVVILGENLADIVSVYIVYVAPIPDFPEDPPILDELFITNTVITDTSITLTIDASAGDVNNNEYHTLVLVDGEGHLYTPPSALYDP